jgi:psp operon transcriptional activator
VAKFEKSLVKTALEQQHNHQGRTAQALGLSYDQLRGLLRKHELTRSRAQTG